jgi:hypothetical protein
MKERRYNINNTVFHITPESPKGVVINARFDLLTGKWEYLVTFGLDIEERWYNEHELSEHKIYE